MTSNTQQGQWGRITLASGLERPAIAYSDHVTYSVHLSAAVRKATAKQAATFVAASWVTDVEAAHSEAISEDTDRFFAGRNVDWSRLYTYPHRVAATDTDTDTDDATDDGGYYNEFGNYVDENGDEWQYGRNIDEWRHGYTFTGQTTDDANMTGPSVDWATVYLITDPVIARWMADMEDAERTMDALHAKALAENAQFDANREWFVRELNQH